MRKEIFHSLILIVIIAFSFFLTKTPLFKYDLQLTGLIFLFYFFGKRFFFAKIKSKILDFYVFEAIIFTLLILNVINATGKVNSPLFFLNYFLIFALSLILEQEVALTTSFTLVIFYILSLPQNFSLNQLIPVFSLPFLTPFALILGEERIKIQKLKRKNQKIQEETFLFLTLIIKNHLKTIKEAVENFMGDHHLEIIKKTTNRMEKLIEKYEKQI